MRLAVGVLLGVTAVASAQSLQSEVGKAEALGARTGVCVLDGSGRVVYEHRAREAVTPASNQKLLTAAAVLHGLGDDFRFRTRFALRDGQLVVHASADPNWITATAHAPLALFGEVAATLQRRGVTAVRGLTLDRGVFTGPARPDGWPQNQLHTYYCAPTGPFVLEQGIFAVCIDPRGQSRTAALRLLAPPVGPRLTGAIDLVGGRGVSSCGAIDLGDRVKVRGKLSRRAGVVTIRTAVADPALWYERTLREVLRQAGIAVDADAALLADADVLEVTTALGPALLRMLEDSSNFDAEQCMRALGAARQDDGSLAGGRLAMHAELEAMVGTVPAEVVFADGSGLSQDNRTTPAFVAAVLHCAAAHRIGATLRQALPIAGRTGTLADRFAGTDLVGRVHAKTGWIRGASSLSGYVETAGGERCCFAILMAYDRSRSGLNKHLKQAQERIVQAIALRGGG